eukprot:scaffold2631_cov412-Prasinococcus_capsulatus_cf.AAC.13
MQAVAKRQQPKRRTRGTAEEDDAGDLDVEDAEALARKSQRVVDPVTAQPQTIALTGASAGPSTGTEGPVVAHVPEAVATPAVEPKPILKQPTVVEVPDSKSVEMAQDVNMKDDVVIVVPQKDSVDLTQGEEDASVSEMPTSMDVDTSMDTQKGPLSEGRRVTFADAVIERKETASSEPVQRPTESATVLQAIGGAEPKKADDERAQPHASESAQQVDLQGLDVKSPTPALVPEEAGSAAPVARPAEEISAAQVPTEPLIAEGSGADPGPMVADGSHADVPAMGGAIASDIPTICNPQPSADIAKGVDRPVEVGSAAGDVAVHEDKQGSTEVKDGLVDGTAARDAARDTLVDVVTPALAEQAPTAETTMEEACLGEALPDPHALPHGEGVQQQGRAESRPITAPEPRHVEGAPEVVEKKQEPPGEAATDDPTTEAPSAAEHKGTEETDGQASKAAAAKEDVGEAGKEQTCTAAPTQEGDDQQPRTDEAAVQ